MGEKAVRKSAKTHRVQFTPGMVCQWGSAWSAAWSFLNPAVIICELITMLNSVLYCHIYVARNTQSLQSWKTENNWNFPSIFTYKSIIYKKKMTQLKNLVWSGNHLFKFFCSKILHYYSELAIWHKSRYGNYIFIFSIIPESNRQLLSLQKGNHLVPNIFNCIHLNCVFIFKNCNVKTERWWLIW